MFKTRLHYTAEVSPGLDDSKWVIDDGRIVPFVRVGNSRVGYVRTVHDIRYFAGYYIRGLLSGWHGRHPLD